MNIIFSTKTKKKLNYKGPVVQLNTCLPAGRECQIPENNRKMAYFTYAIKSKIDGRIYVGMAADVDKRIAEHNAGRTKSTKGYKPWKLVYSEELPDRMAARNREKYLKSGCGKEFLKNLAP